MGGISWVADDGYAEKYGRERRTATVELSGIEARVLHTAEEELPGGRSHHVVAYVKVEGVEMGRKDGWHLGENGLDKRTLEIAAEAVGEARETLARVDRAASELLGPESEWSRGYDGGLASGAGHVRTISSDLDHTKEFVVERNAGREGLTPEESLRAWEEAGLEAEHVAQKRALERAIRAIGTSLHVPEVPDEGEVTPDGRLVERCRGRVEGLADAMMQVETEVLSLEGERRFAGSVRESAGWEEEAIEGHVSGLNAGELAALRRTRDRISGLLERVEARLGEAAGGGTKA